MGRQPLHALVTERSDLSQLAMCRPPQLAARPASPVPNVGAVLGQSAPGTNKKDGLYGTARNRLCKDEKACGQSGQVSNFVQIFYSNLRKHDGSKHQSQAAKCFASTLKIFSDRASSNRTEHASGEGSVHAFSICVARIQAALTPAAKSVPGMRRRDHSCRG
jgi:hypothetical protein